MSRQRQLDALRKVREAEEQEALRERASAEKVHASRQAGVTALEEEREKILRQISEIKAPRAAADLAQMQTQAEYIKRLKIDLEKLEAQLNTARADCLRAEDRARLSTQEANAARVEKKKMEHLLSKDKKQNLLADYARTESEADELSRVPGTTGNKEEV